MIVFMALRGVAVCICGPARSNGQMVDLERRLGLAGAVVFGLVPPGGELSPLERAGLAALHLRKIEAAGAVVVANVGGYTGPDTGEEIAYAMRLGRTMMFLEEPVVIEAAAEEYSGYVGRIRTLLIRPASEPGDLTRGTVMRIRPGDGEERCAWFRAAEVLRFPSMLAAIAAIDPAEALPGADAEDLARQLSARYPGCAEQEYFVAGLEFLGERCGDQPQPTEPPGPVAMLLVRGPGATVALERGASGALSLPGVPVGPGEHPFPAAARHMKALFDTHVVHERLLTFDHDPGTGCARYVFDAGALEPERLARALRAGGAAGDRLVFADPEQIRRLVHPRTARVIDAVLADPSGAFVLQHGYREGQRLVWEWCEADQPPTGVPVTQAGVWAFDRDGRVVLQHRVERGGAFALPAGSPEPEDRDWLGTAAREAYEESQILIDQRRARLIGFQVTYGDHRYPSGLAQARYVAPLLGYFPIAPDTDPKLTNARAPYRRYLLDIRDAARLLDWGPHAETQARSAEQAALELGLPADRPAAASYRDHGDPHLAEMSSTWDALL